MSVESQAIGISLGQNEESPEVFLGLGRSNSTSAATAAAAATDSTPSPATLAAPSYTNPTQDDSNKYGPLFPYGLKDVKISAIEDQPTTKGKRGVMTRLIGIGDVETQKMDVKQLRNWGNREKMNLRNATKKDYCVAIVTFTEQHRRMQQTGRSLAAPETIYARSRINFVRAINVLSYEGFKARLINRGSQITRAELDNGVRADEELWKYFAELYNETGTAIAIMDLDDLKWENIDWNGNEPDPSQFTPITWQKAQSAFKEMSKKYDIAHKKWKASGFHDGFETVPFTEFAGQKWICYMHEFIKESPGILDTITSDLAEGTFSESTTGHSDDENAGAEVTRGAAAAGRSNSSSSRKKRKATIEANVAREHFLKSIADSSATNAAANEEKSKAIKLAALAQTRSTTQAMLETAKSQKKEALKSLKSHAVSKRDNNRVRIMVNHIAKREYEKEKTVSSSAGLDDEDEPIFQLSQETTDSIRRLDSFDTVYGFAKDFNEANKQIIRCEEALKSLDDF